MSAVRDTMTIFIRESQPVWHQPASMAFNLVQPLVFLGMFGSLLAGMAGEWTTASLDGAGASAGSGASVWQWYVPGILIMLCLFGPTNAGYTLLMEMQTGAHERLLVTPMNRSAMLVGRALKEIAPLVAQAVLIIAVTVPFGFSLHLPGALIGLVMLSVFGVGLAGLSLVILSGVLLPLDVGPTWMRVAGRINPLTSIVDAERALFADDIATRVVLQGAVAALGVVIVGVAVGTRAMRRSTA